MDSNDQILELVEIGIPMILFILLTFAFCGFICKKNKFFKNNYSRLFFTFFLVAVVCGWKVWKHNHWPMDNKIFQALAEMASVLTIPLLLTIIFEPKHETKTKAVTTETVKMDTNGVGRYERITTVTKEE